MNNPANIDLRRGCAQRPIPSNNVVLPINPRNNQNSPSSPSESYKYMYLVFYKQDEINL